MTYKLRFFSIPTEDVSARPGAITPLGYDGSMTVEEFDPTPETLQELARRMDCVCGPCLITAEVESVTLGRTLHYAYSFIRTPAV